jgi:putative SOS response-associated peptidase YedK
MTALPNALTASINHERSPVFLTSEAEHDLWLNGTPEQAFGMVRPYPAENMQMAQEGFDNRD